MEETEFLVVGAGVSGLSFAGRVGRGRCLVLEAASEPGGYCRTVVRDGFTWDYSGHFFHFKRPEIERELVAKMGGQEVLVVNKESRILWPGGDVEGRFVDFPFQKNIHQLPKNDFMACLYDLFFRDDGSPEHFEAMLYAKFGRSIADKFLIPYNEKLYATSLKRLDVDAMGRFFPHADLKDIIGNFRAADNGSYNQTFTYPAGGAIQYIKALLADVDASDLRLSERVVSVDRGRKIATTTRGEVKFDKLVSSAPFPSLAAMIADPVDQDVFSANKVMVFNLGFDRKGLSGVHWVYVPQREYCFYRVGYYDNIFDNDRMSLYVEVGLEAGAAVDVDEMRQQVLADLGRAGFVTDQKLVASHSVVLDPAYVHVNRAAQAVVAEKKAAWAADGIYTIGRYGSWTYCSIEDNIVEARDLADAIGVV